MRLRARPCATWAPPDPLPVGGSPGSPGGWDLELSLPGARWRRQPILAERGELDREVDAAPEEPGETG